MDPTIDPKAYFAVVDERDEARRKLEEVFDSWQQAERRIGEVEKERDSLAARVKALRKSALEHASWLVCGMFEVQDTPQGMRLSGSARRWLANERIEVRDRLNNAAVALRKDVDADKSAAPESKPAKPATEPAKVECPECEGDTMRHSCAGCPFDGYRNKMDGFCEHDGDCPPCPACGGSGVGK